MVCGAERGQNKCVGVYPVISFSRLGAIRVLLPILLVVSPEEKMEFSLSAFTPESLVLGFAVPSCVNLLILLTQLESDT